MTTLRKIRMEAVNRSQQRTQNFASQFTNPFLSLDQLTQSTILLMTHQIDQLHMQKILEFIWSMGCSTHRQYQPLASPTNIQLTQRVLKYSIYTTVIVSDRHTRSEVEKYAKLTKPPPHRGSRVIFECSENFVPKTLQSPHSSRIAQKFRVVKKPAFGEKAE